MITCNEAIKNATGKDYPVDEIDEFIKQADRIKNKIMNDANVHDKTQAIMDELDNVATNMVEAQKIEKRNAMINQMRLSENMDFIQSQYNDDLGKGIHAMLVGDERIAAGSRYSVDAEQKALSNMYRGGLAHDLEAAGLFKMVTSHELDRDIARHLAGEKITDKDAINAAEIIRKYQELARRDANKAGAWIKKTDGYITRQTHDADAIAKSTEAEYIDFLKQKLDLEKTLDGVDDPDTFFESLYDALSTGVHLSSSPKEITTAFKGNANLARKLSEGRVLHFKSADAFMDYNDMYGSGDLISTVLQGLDSSADSTGLMRKLGTNPESMIDTLYDQLSRTVKGDEKVKLKKSKGKTDNYMAEVTGLTRIAGNQMAAKVMSNVRAWQSLAKLGGALLSSISDTVTYAGEVRYQGGNLLSGLAESMKAVGKGRGTVEHRQIMANLGVSMDSFLGDLSSRWQSGDPLSGLTQKSLNTFFKWNGLTWWSDAMKRSAAIGTSNRLYQQADIAFNSLDSRSTRIMKMYGIGEPEWNIIRKSKQVTEDGTGLLTPEAMKGLPDDDFIAMIESQGLKPTDMRIEALRDELERKLRNYVSDRTGYAQLETDARSRAVFNRGTQRGTVPGELFRLAAQFKQYPTIFLQRTLGREVKGRAKGTADDKFFDSPLYGVASLFTALTVGGYVAMTAKDIAKGREPRDPSNYKTWLAAAVQGGGAGIYGDFLFGDVKNRFGGGYLDTLAGPSLGLISTVADLWGRARSGDDLASTAFTNALNNTPYANLFYTRIALDYMILYDVRESLNPGYMRRMEKRLKKENDQEFFLPPSQNALRPFTR